jgi:pimeloyl-ACP methyl ester carboxylesterase
LRLPTCQGETFVIASGEEGQPALLLLHGASINSAMWMGDVAAWAAHFRVFAVDVIGDPGLSAPSRPRLASDAHTLWLDDVMRGLSLDRASFVGVSNGGWLALDYAIRRPERVERLVALCPGGVVRSKNILLVALPLLLLGKWGTRKLIKRILGSTPAAASDAQRRFGEFMSLIFQNVRPRTERHPVFGDDELSRLTLPVLAILGAKDAVIDSRAVQQRLARVVPHAAIRWVADAGHAIPGQTQPILEFLRSAKAAAHGCQAKPFSG